MRVDKLFIVILALSCFAGVLAGSSLTPDQISTILAAGIITLGAIAGLFMWIDSKLKKQTSQDQGVAP
jgi:hypothetical protein